MYGLINNALKKMIQTSYGDEVWKEILDQSGVGEDAFVSMQNYDDGLTYDLVGASSKVLNASPEQCLELFGDYWVSVTAKEAYGMLMDATGTDLLSFLENINQLHDRITSTFVGYIPPYFELDRENSVVCLRYESKREGLTPFVLGILKGLSKNFGQTLTMVSVERCEVDSGEMSLIRFTVQ